MGAYLSQPKRDKDSADDANDYLHVGSSSMQGWRTSQEDAHNAILDFDTDSAFFAVFDGHGGAEVAAYCAAQLPNYLKQLPPYSKGDFVTALKEAFMGFDASLLEPEVAEILRELAEETNSKENSDDEVEDLVELHEESNLPLNKVLEKYKGGEGAAALGFGPSMPGLEKLKDGSDKPQSPYLRGRRAAALLAEAVNKAVMNPDAKPEGSSTSAAARAAVSSNEVGPSSSKSAAIKMDTTEEDSTVSSSSSSSTSKSATTANNTKPEAAATVENVKDVKEAATLNGAGGGADKKVAAASAAVPEAAVKDGAKELVSPDSSLAVIKENEQNGSVTSSASPKAKADVSTGEATVSGSSDAAVKVVRIQNGTVGSTSSVGGAVAAATAAAALAAGGTISSTSKTTPVVGADDDEEDADYEVENSDVEGENDVAEEESSEEEADSDVEADVNEMSFAADDDDDEIDSSEEDDDDDEDRLGPRAFFPMGDEVPGKDSGCTAVVALLKGRDLYVANAGDSRCVVCRSGHAIEMSLDHKPEDEEETLRILKAGGRVTGDGRVNGGLNLSRAIGDHGYKMNADLPAEEQMITAMPDIKKLIIQPDDEFMVLACDGIWNYMSSEEVVQFVRERINIEGKKLSQICEELFENCLAPNTTGDGTGCDNMTAVIVRFQEKILQLETKIDSKEAEDLPAKSKDLDGGDDDESAKKSQKRPFDDMNSNEVEHTSSKPTKRLKTDDHDDDDDDELTDSNMMATTISCSSSSSSSSKCGISIKTAASATTTITTTSTSGNANEMSPGATITTTTTMLVTSEEKECTTTATS